MAMVKTFEDHSLIQEAGSWIADSAEVIGDVTLKKRCEHLVSKRCQRRLRQHCDRSLQQCAGSLYAPY